MFVLQPDETIKQQYCKEIKRPYWNKTIVKK